MLLGAAAALAADGAPPSEPAALLGQVAGATAPARGQIERTLMELGETARPAVTAGLADPHPDVRASAAYVLAMLSPKSQTAAAQIRPLLRDPEWYVQMHATLALGRVGVADEASLAQLAALLGDDNPSLARAAAWALRWIGPAAIPTLQKVRLEGNATARAMAGIGLRNRSDKRQVRDRPPRPSPTTGAP